MGGAPAWVRVEMRPVVRSCFAAYTVAAAGVASELLVQAAQLLQHQQMLCCLLLQAILQVGKTPGFPGFEM